MMDSLQHTIIRGISMAKDFRMRVTGDSVYINFGDEAHRYDRPDSFVAERVIAGFSESPPDMPLSPLKQDEAAYDG